MYFVVSGRMTGKTTTVIRWWAASPESRTIVASSMQRHDYIIRAIRASYPKLGSLANEAVIVPSNNLSDIHLMRNGEIAIDDLDDLLQRWIGNVHLATASGIPILPANNLRETGVM